MENEDKQKNLVMVFRIIVGLIVVVGILALVFLMSKPFKIVDGYDCFKHQGELISLCKEKQDCAILEECMKYYDEDTVLYVEQRLNESTLVEVDDSLNESNGNISETDTEFE